MKVKFQVHAPEKDTIFFWETCFSLDTKKAGGDVD